MYVVVVVRSESDILQWSNLSSYKESPEKNLMLQRDSNRFQRDLTPWPPWYRCDALPTELVGSKSWSVQFIPVIWREWDCVLWYKSYIWTADKDFQRSFIAQLVEHRTGIWTHDLRGTDFFLHFFSNCLKLLHDCEDHFHFYSLSAIHIYDLYHMHLISLLLFCTLYMM